MFNLKNIHDYPLGFGAAGISGCAGGYSFGEVSEKDACNLLLNAFDQGFRVYDSAPIYGFGESERRLGKAFSSIREKIFLVSKCGVSWHSSKRVNMSNAPDLCESMLHESLKRFKSEYIDLYMIHWPDKRVDIRRTMEVLVKAKEKSKIRFLGLCNCDEKEFLKAGEVAPIDFYQGEFNFYRRENFEFLENKKVKTMGWGTLDKGILAGSVDENRNFEKSDARSWAPWWKKLDKSKAYKTAELLQKELKDEGLTILDFSINFSRKFLDLPLLGIKTQDQLHAANKALTKTVSEELLQRTEEIYRELWQK